MYMNFSCVSLSKCDDYCNSENTRPVSSGFVDDMGLPGSSCLVTMEAQLDILRVQGPLASPSSASDHL